MNSDGERAIFEAHGWEFDAVRREWRAPDGFTVSTDDLVAAAATLGREVERRIRRVALEHGRARG